MKFALSTPTPSGRPQCTHAPSRAIVAWAAVALLCAAAGAVHADPGAEVRTQVYRQNYPGGVVYAPDCTTTLSLGRFSETSGGVCDMDQYGVLSTSTVFASATGPTSLFALAELKASSSIAMVNGTSPTNIERRQYTQASASAEYVDYIRLLPGAAATATIEFQLTGSLALDDPPQFYAVPASASAGFGVSIFQGRYYGGGSFGGSWESSLGWTSVDTTLLQGGSPTTKVWNDPGNAADYSLTSLAGGVYRVTLGPSFFANSAYPDLSVQFALGTYVNLYGEAFFPGLSVSGSADFSNTLKMTSFVTYDSQGNDVTSQAVIGFASADFPAAPVPEPGRAALLAAGLVLLTFKTLRPGSRAV